MNLKSGFTLIEILVALLAASIISIMSFEFLSNTVFLKENVNKNIKADSDHMNAINTIRFDLLQTVPFKMKDQDGRYTNESFIGKPSEKIMTFITLNSGDYLQKTSKLRRVIYLYEDNQLIRLTTLSNKEEKEISKKVLLENITNLEIRYGMELDDNEDVWPNFKYQSSHKFPRYIVINYEIDDREYKQIFSTFK